MDAQELGDFVWVFEATCQDPSYREEIVEAYGQGKYRSYAQYYQEQFPGAAEAIKLLFGLPKYLSCQMWLDQQTSEGSRRPEIEALYWLVGYRDRLMKFLMAVESPVAAAFWAAGGRFKEIVRPPGRLAGLRQSVLAEMAVWWSLEELGMRPRRADYRSNIFKGVDLWALEESWGVQVKQRRRSTLGSRPIAAHTAASEAELQLSLIHI